MKIESEYLSKYGNIPKDEVSRFQYLCNDLKLSKRSKLCITDEMDRILNIKWKTERFIIYLVPKSTPRPRYNISRKIFYVSGASDNKKLFKKFMKNQDIPMIITPCKFESICYLPIPNNMTKLEKILAELGLIYPMGKPDFDNLAKTYADMVTGSLIYDDALIIEGISKKFYSIKPRIELTIKYMTEYDCHFNENKLRKKGIYNE